VRQLSPWQFCGNNLLDSLFPCLNDPIDQQLSGIHYPDPHKKYTDPSTSPVTQYIYSTKTATITTTFILYSSSIEIQELEQFTKKVQNIIRHLQTLYNFSTYLFKYDTEDNHCNDNYTRPKYYLKQKQQH